MTVVGVSIMQGDANNTGFGVTKSLLRVSALSITAWSQVSDYLREHNFEKLKKWVLEEYFLLVLPH